MENKKYCVFCGTENNIAETACTNCHKELHPKENLLIDFLIEHTKDELKGHTEDSLYEVLMNYLKSHLFGVIFSISLITTITASVLSQFDGIENVTQMPNLKLNQNVPITDNQNSDLQKDQYLSAEQIEIRDTVNEYFFYARNTEELSNADEKENILKTGINEVYSEFFEEYVQAYYQVDEIGKVDSISYKYSIIQPNVKEPTTLISMYFYDEGYQVAEVFLYETIHSVSEQMFLVTLSKHDENWKINEVLCMSNDEKDMLYVEESLWAMANSTFAEGSNETYLPNSFGYVSDLDVKYTVSQEKTGSMYWMIDEGVELSCVHETQMTSLLEKDGHEIAQTTMSLGSYQNSEWVSEKSYLITFVNIGATWYIAEVVEV